MAINLWATTIAILWWDLHHLLKQSPTRIIKILVCSIHRWIFLKWITSHQTFKICQILISKMHILLLKCKKGLLVAIIGSKHFLRMGFRKKKLLQKENMQKRNYQINLLIQKIDHKRKFPKLLTNNSGIVLVGGEFLLMKKILNVFNAKRNSISNVCLSL